MMVSGICLISAFALETAEIYAYLPWISKNPMDKVVETSEGDVVSNMTPFQKQADKLLTANGWEFVRFTGKSYTAYRKGKEMTVVSNSPRNPGTALKQVKKFARIK